MKIKYITEGYFKSPEQMKASQERISKKSSAERLSDKAYEVMYKDKLNALSEIIRDILQYNWSTADSPWDDGYQSREFLTSALFGPYGEAFYFMKRYIDCIYTVNCTYDISKNTVFVNIIVNLELSDYMKKNDFPISEVIGAFYPSQISTYGVYANKNNFELFKHNLLNVAEAYLKKFDVYEFANESNFLINKIKITTNEPDIKSLIRLALCSDPNAMYNFQIKDKLNSFVEFDIPGAVIAENSVIQYNYVIKKADK